MSWTPYDRERPLKGLLKAIELMEKNGGNIIVEIGCMRMKFTHDPHIDCPECLACCDGHSTAVFAKTGHTLYSVDIDSNAINLAKNTIEEYKNANVIFNDGIQFIKNFTLKIDLLFADAWDVGLNNCAENHLKLYQVAIPKLSKSAVVVIDDCDVDITDGQLHLTKLKYGGKGRLIVPAMIKDGWNVVNTGRVVILTR